nr:MAG TPA: helix-turn-helix domain protein [Caudoviricetes sp.]
MANKITETMPKVTYSVKEVSDILGICLPAVYELCNREDFPAIRVTPRRIIIPVDGLRRWMEEQANGMHKEPPKK